MDVNALEISFLNDLESYNRMKDYFLQEDVLLIRGVDFDENQFESLTQNLCSDCCRISSRETLRKTEGDGLTTETPSENFFYFLTLKLLMLPIRKLLI